MRSPVAIASEVLGLLITRLIKFCLQPLRPQSSFKLSRDASRQRV